MAFSDFLQTVNNYPISTSGQLLDFAEKYLGIDIYSLSGGCEITIPTSSISLDFKSGKNSFIFPGGEFSYDSSLVNGNLRITLSASNLNLLATAGSSIDLSDIIVVQRGNEFEAAWLKAFTNEIVNASMIFNISEGHNIIRFPYPGIGLSASNIGWTGKTITDNVRRRNITSKDIALNSSIKKLYWEDFNNSTSSVSAIDSISIHQTSLITQGAYADNNYFLADKITVRPTPYDSVRNGVYNGDETTTWLYDFNHTEMPILGGNNAFYWPLEKLKSGEQTGVEKPTFPMNRNQLGTGPTGAPLEFPLSSMSICQSFCGAVAASNPTSADKIYKRQSFCDERIEGAWLRGCALSSINELYGIGNVHPGVTFIVQSGETVSFVWPFEDVNINEVFGGFEHDAYCEYLQTEHPEYINDVDRSVDSVDFDSWKSCNCKAVYYSPLGLSNRTQFDKFPEFFDYIYEELSIDFLEGDYYKNSNQFGIFQHTPIPNVENDVGFGKNGSWATYSGNTFLLRKGALYTFKRASLKNCGNVPPFVATYCPNTCNTCTPEWRKMNFVNGDWIDAGVTSDMTMKATDIIEYDHQPCYYFSYPIFDSSSQIVSSTETRTVAVNTIQSTTLMFDFETGTNGWIPSVLGIGEFSDPFATVTQSPFNPATVFFPTNTNSLDVTWPNVSAESSQRNWGAQVTLNLAQSNLLKSGNLLKMDIFVPSALSAGAISEIGIGVSERSLITQPINITNENWNSIGGEGLFRDVELSYSVNLTTPIIDLFIGRNNQDVDGETHEFFIDNIRVCQVQTTLSDLEFIRFTNSSTITTNENKIKNNAVDFIWNVPIPESQPYWAKSIDKYNFTYGTSATEITDYLYKVQPDPTDLILTDDIYMDYFRNQCGGFTWTEPLKFNVNLRTVAPVWKKLDINYVNAPMLSRIIHCDICAPSYNNVGCLCLRERGCDVNILTFTPTLIDSNIQLETYYNCDNLTRTFLFAKNNFTWSQDNVEIISLSKESLPESNLLIDAKRPWNNIYNRSLDGIVIKSYSTGELKAEDTYGIFNPNLLGTNIFFMRDSELGIKCK